MKKLIILLLVLQAQIGASQSVLISPNNGSKLIESNSTNKAIQMPSVATTSAIASPQKGMVVFDDATGNLSYFNGSIWVGLSNSTIGWAVSGTNLSNTNTGNVGIGDPSPSQKLEVAGTILAQTAAINATSTAPNTNAMLDIASTTKGVLFPRMTTAQRNLIPVVTGLTVYDNTTKGFWFHDGVDWRPLNSTWITAEDSSYTNAFTNIKAVGIGATPKNTGAGGVGGSVTNGRLQITGFNNGDQLSLIHPSNPVLKWGFYVGAIDSSLNFYYNGSLRANIDRVTGVFAALSDKNLKKNIAAINPVLDNVVKLNAYKYNFLKSADSDRKSIGFMAQDVLPYFPELVYQKKDRETKEPFLMMDYSGFGVIAIKAIQEQQELINNLQIQIDELRKLIGK
jgi:hypothetical protein